MSKFRLKPEATPFFKEDLATKILDFDNWEKLNVDQSALEKVEEVYIEYGIKSSDNSSNLSGWDEKGSRFHFTLRFPSIKLQEHDKFNNGRTTRELMGKIQSLVNRHFEDFNNN